MSEAKAPAAHTERSILDALRLRHAPKQRGNGPEWAFMEHVRDSAGFNANRTIDAIALGLWPSRGMELHGYEVKVSRADFRRELADPSKMDAFARILDRFWIVAPKGIVPKDELPATWGLLEVGDDGTTIRQKVAAPLLTESRVAIPRSFLVPLLRAAGAAVKSRPEDIEDAHRRGFKEGVAANRSSGTDWQRMYEQQSEQLKEARVQVAAVEAALGLNVSSGYLRSARDERLRAVAGAVKLVVEGDEAHVIVQREVSAMHRQLAFAISSLERAQRDIATKTGVEHDQ